MPEVSHSDPLGSLPSKDPGVGVLTIEVRLIPRSESMAESIVFRASRNACTVPGLDLNRNLLRLVEFHTRKPEALSLSTCCPICFSEGQA